MRSLPDALDPADPLAPYRALLAQPRLTVISAEPDRELDGMARTIRGSVRIAGRAELEVLLGRLVAASAGAQIAPRTLDLLGHSTAHGALLRLGDWVIDAADPTVAAFFRALAAHGVLARLGITAVRLLGCRTSDTDAGRATICRLAELLGVEVFGTRHLLYDAHYDEAGFRDAWQFLLVSASDLARAAQPADVTAPATWPRTLDLDALPAFALAAAPTRWPRRQMTRGAVHQLLALIRRDAGGRLAARATAPSCELALPSAVPEQFHLAHVLFDGAFVRFYPDGPDGPVGSAAAGVLYPVDDPHELRRVTDALPLALR